jgi:hypothetical protein
VAFVQGWSGIAISSETRDFALKWRSSTRR